MFLAVTVANALVIKFRSRSLIAQRPELASGYRRLFWGYLTFLSLPWLVMGYGIELGGIPNMFSFFRPREGNPIVLTFFATTVVLWILALYWLFARQGAEFLIEHPGVFRGIPQNPTFIKAWFCLAIAGGVVALIAMSIVNF